MDSKPLWLELDAEATDRYKHLQPHRFSHQLATHPLLKIERLAELIQALPRDQVYFSSSALPLNTDFHTAWRDFKASTDLATALANMDAAGAYVMVRSPENDPNYRGLFSELRDQMRDFLAQMDPGLRSCMLYLFISSPHCVTPYHVDRYITYLCQISGTKQVHIWDRHDREVLSETALESLFATPSERGPLLMDDHQSRGQVFELHPGQGVHIPFTSPHWVQNGPQVSVSVAFIYQTLATSRRESAYRCNHWLRHRFALEPMAVDRWPWVDWVKFVGFRGTEKLLGRR